MLEIQDGLVAESPNRFGLSVALATPFRSDRTINYDTMVAHAGWCLERGCGSVTLFGTTGEGPSLSAREREDAYAAFRASGIEGGRLVAAVIANAAGDATGQINAAYEAGARAVLLAPPSYFKGVTADGAIRWLADVIGALGNDARDIILYNIPSLTGITLTSEIVSALRSEFGTTIAGVKDSGCNWAMTQSLLAAHGDIDVLVGDERDLARAVRSGAAGSICGLANAFPEVMAEVARGRENRTITELVNLIDGTGLVIPSLKALIAETTGDQAWSAVRPPLARLTADTQTKLIKQMKGLKRMRAA